MAIRQNHTRQKDMEAAVQHHSGFFGALQYLYPASSTVTFDHEKEIGLKAPRMDGLLTIHEKTSPFPDPIGSFFKQCNPKFPKFSGLHENS
ncbi:MAG: hypothetical protein IJ083_08150 [Clostridia bacterium]|nr:hypothetical protein [Clostridia bacterium]